MKLVRLPLNCIVNFDNITHVDYSPATVETNYETGAPIDFKARLIIRVIGGDAVEFVEDDAERIWAYLVDQSYVMA